MKRFFYSLITGEDNKIFYVLFRPLLICLSFIYVNIVRLIRFFYRINLLKSVRSKPKVISVGNITWGGTGKTSFVTHLSRFLDSRNKKTAILIRGYGSDEDKMLKEQLKEIIVLSGRNRLENAKKAENEYKTDILILDDGFQHWRIKRDLDIVTINATNPFGNGMVIPAGILREPLSSLKRADIAILTKVNLAGKKDVAKIRNIIYDIAPEIEIFEAEYQPISLTEASTGKEFACGYIAAKRLCAVAGIGDNNSFFKMLSDLGAEITISLPYPDHHKYTLRDIKDITGAFKKTNSDLIITTRKDWIRLKLKWGQIGPDPFTLLLLNIIIKVKDEERLFDRIYSLLNR